MAGIQKSTAAGDATTSENFGFAQEGKAPTFLIGDGEKEGQMQNESGDAQSHWSGE